MELCDLFMDDNKEGDWDLPKYSDKGDLLVEIVAVDDNAIFKYELESTYYNSDTCIMWINEGMGIEYWLEQYTEIQTPGWYVIEGIQGAYIKGEWGLTDDDEEWEYENIRPATSEEIEQECL